MNIIKALTFKDVLLVPKYSEIETRDNVSTNVKMGDFLFRNPLIPANMKDIVGYDMLEASVKNQTLCFMHRFVSFEEQLSALIKIQDDYPRAFDYLGVSLGVKNEDFVNAKKFYKAGIRLFVIDVAHGDHINCHQMIRKLKQNYPDIFLVAGNVASWIGASNLLRLGIDCLKIGIGNGSICSTRIQTGNGVPQLYALQQAQLAKERFKEVSDKQVYIISDGGCVDPGDVCKALCLSDMVMAGGVFAGCPETPGKITTINGRIVKTYQGSSTYKSTHIEGYIGSVSLKPSFEQILDKFKQGIQSCCSYQGVDEVSKLQISPEFVEITNSGIIESGAHDIYL